LLSDESYRRQAAALGAGLREAGGVQKAADAIISFVARD
jgi:UDP:flavonoid glycosyltransferase YjiC (YdhE family)